MSARHILAKYLGGDPRLPKRHEADGTNAILRASSNGEVEITLLYGKRSFAGGWCGGEDPHVCYQPNEIRKIERIHSDGSGLNRLYDMWVGLGALDKYRLRVQTDEVIGGEFDVLLAVGNQNSNLEHFIAHAREGERERSVWLAPWAATILGEELIRQQLIELLSNEPARSDGMSHIPCVPGWVVKAMGSPNVSAAIWECNCFARGQPH
jgi:hypothetical protein